MATTPGSRSDSASRRAQAAQPDVWQNPLTTTLAGQDQFFGPPGMGPDYDYPNPLPPRYPIDNRTFLNPLERQLIGQDTFFGAPGQPPAREPDGPPIGRPHPVDLRTHVCNLLLTTLLVTQAPFSLSDQPNPRRPTPPPVGFTSGLNLTLAGQDTFFGAAGQPPANLDQPLPPRAAPRAIALLTHAQDTPLQLQGKDTFYGAPGQVPTYEPPPNPIAAPFPLSLRTHLDPLKLTLKGQDTFFGGAGQAAPNRDWPNPLPVRRATDLLTWVQGLPAAPLPTPFAQSEWQNPPRGAIPGIELRTWLGNLLESTLGGVSARPFAQADWPVPRPAGYALSLRSHLGSLSLQLRGQDTFYGGPGQPPSFAPAVNPRGRPTPLDLASNGNLLQTTLAIGQAPFGQSDWPNPRALALANDLRTWLQSLPPGSLLPPFTQRDWPLPRGAVAASELRIWLHSLVPGALLPPPFRQTEWPNPRGVAFASDLRTWLQGIPPGALVPPFSQADWPNPRGATPAIDLRTWLQALRLALLGQDRMYGAPGQVPTYEPPPNPIAAPFPSELRTLAENLIQGTLGLIPVPFNQFDWPVPPGPRRASDLRTLLDTLRYITIPGSAYSRDDLTRLASLLDAVTHQAAALDALSFHALATDSLNTLTASHDDLTTLTTDNDALA